MDLKYLHTFKTILETGSFQKAAERLHYAQSTITLQMQLLEQEVSVKLFEKIGRKMHLTPAGKELLPYIDNILTTVQQMKNHGKSENEWTGTLRIAMPETLLSYQMPQELKSYRKKAPNIKLSLQTPNCYEIREQVLNGVVDFGLHYDIGGYGPSLIVEKIRDYELVLTGCTELNQEEQDFISKKQRKNICLLTTDKNSLYQKIFREYLRKSDITLNGEMELASTEAIKRSVIANLGVAFLPRFTVEKELKLGILQELSTAIQEKKIGLVYTYHKNKWITPAMDLFIQLLKNKTCGDSVKPDRL